MKIIARVNEFGYTEEEIEKFPVSKKARGVVFLDDNVVCIEEDCYGLKGVLGLPGGTIEENEDEISAFEREVKEETGYSVKKIIFLGVIELIWKDLKSITYCYKAETDGLKEKQSLEAKEIEGEVCVLEMSFNEALNRIKKELEENSNGFSFRAMKILEEVENK